MSSQSLSAALGHKLHDHQLVLHVLADGDVVLIGNAQLPQTIHQHIEMSREERQQFDASCRSRHREEMGSMPG